MQNDDQTLFLLPGSLKYLFDYCVSSVANHEKKKKKKSWHDLTVLQKHTSSTRVVFWGRLFLAADDLQPVFLL